MMARESMTSKTTKTDSNHEVPPSEVQPLRIAMNPKLLKATRTGDKTILDELLQQKNLSFGASEGEIAIRVQEVAATQKDISCLLGVTLEGNTALHIVASRGYLELAEKIIHRERSLLAAPNTRLDTPLHCAARAGDDKMVSLIIQFAKEDVMEARRVLRATNKDNNNALHEAAKYDHVHVAKVLMEEDAVLASMLNCADMPPLFLAIATGSLNVAKALLHSSSWRKACLASYGGPNKTTVLHVAAARSREITKDILQRNATLAKDANQDGLIPLHIAALGGDRDTAKLLLEHDPSTAYVPNGVGFFPIHIAAIKGNIGVVDQILEQCPDTEELLNQNGMNFLHLAFKCGKLDLVKKIISKRPDLRKLLKDQDNEGNTPLHTAVENGDQWSVYFLLRDNSVSPNIINHDGLTPLNIAFTRMEKGIHSGMNATSCILSCLAFAKALFGDPKNFRRVVLSRDEDEKKPFGDDKVKEKSSSNEDKKKQSGNDEVKEKLSGDDDRKKPSGDDKIKENSSGFEETKMMKLLKESQDEELKKQLNVSKNFVITTVLIATVTFAAGFTVPGGYIADDHPGRGTAVLAKEYAFKVFLVSDAFAFVCSILATVWYVIGGLSTYDIHTRMRTGFFASWCVRWAFCGMSTAFAMGIYATSPPSFKAISILLCIIALATPFLADVVAGYNLYSFQKTIGIRHGYRQWIWPTTIHPPVKKFLRPVLLPPNSIILSFLSALALNAIFFLLPML